RRQYTTVARVRSNIGETRAKQVAGAAQAHGWKNHITARGIDRTTTIQENKNAVPRWDGVRNLAVRLRKKSVLLFRFGFSGGGLCGFGRGRRRGSGLLGFGGLQPRGILVARIVGLDEFDQRHLSRAADTGAGLVDAGVATRTVEEFRDLLVEE